MDFEEILNKVGNYGKYQRRLFYLMLLPYSFLASWFHILPYFMISSPDHWCKVPVLEKFSQATQSQIIRPIETDVYGRNKSSNCQMWDLDYESLLKNQFNSFSTSFHESNETSIIEFFKPYLKHVVATRPCNQGWVFDKSDYDETLVTNANLVCDRSHMTNHVMSVGGLGAAIGTPLFGALSDVIGRKKSLLWVNIIFLVSTYSPTFCKNYYAYLLSRFILSLIYNAMFQIPFILIIEMVGPNHRAQMGTMASLIWGVGLTTVPGIAYVLRSWVYFNYAIMFSGFIFLGLYFIVPESPRWLIANGKYKKADKILKEIATTNQVPNAVNTVYIKKFSLVGRKSSLDFSIPLQKGSAYSFVSNWRIFKLFATITFGYIASSMTYNGLHLNTLSLAGNQFLNFFLLTVIEIPACLVALYLMETRLGRRWSCSLTLTLSGSCLLTAATFGHNPSMMMILSAIGKFLNALSFSILYQLAVEIYPTPLRNQGLSLSATISNLQSVALSQFISQSPTGDASNAIPLLIIGLVCVFSGVCLTTIPETLNENLPQTIEDAENFGKYQKYWALAKSK